MPFLSALLGFVIGVVFGIWLTKPEFFSQFGKKKEEKKISEEEVKRIEQILKKLNEKEGE